MISSENVVDVLPVGFGRFRTRGGAGCSRGASRLSSTSTGSTSAVGTERPA
jgi:hypothetical protein